MEFKETCRPPLPPGQELPRAAHSCLNRSSPGFAGPRCPLRTLSPGLMPVEFEEPRAEALTLVSSQDKEESKAPDTEGSGPSLEKPAGPQIARLPVLRAVAGRGGKGLGAGRGRAREASWVGRETAWSAAVTCRFQSLRALEEGTFPYPAFTEEETDAQRGELSSLESRSDPRALHTGSLCNMGSD